MKMYLIVILFCIFVIIGVLVYITFLVRYRLYKDLCYICNSLSTNINFNKRTIDDILDTNYSKVGFLTRCFILHNDIYNKLISKDKVNFIRDFFENLGRGDISFELNNISYYEKEFKVYESEAKEELKKKGGVYFKLIIGLGLMVCIILI